MTKSPDAFRTISEVAAWLGVQAHVLRFWESKFPQVKPIKRAGGRRYYRPADMRLIGGIKTLLHDDGMTIKGVQKILREQGIPYVSDMSPSLEGDQFDEIPLIEAEEERGTVLAFKAKPSSPILVQRPIETVAAAELTPEDTAEDEITPDQTVAPSGTDMTAATDSQVAAPEAESPTDSPSEPARVGSPAESPAESVELPLIDQPQAPLAPIMAAEDQPAAEETAAAEADIPVLPSFLAPGHAASPLATPPHEQPAGSDTAMAAGSPDTGPQDDLRYAPGLLGHLAGITRLSRLEAARIAPFARALRDWHDRQEKTIGR